MKKILIVDDISSIRNVLKTIIELKGIEVKEAHNGNEALEKINSQKFDLIITDINMPEVNGYELITRARLKDIETPMIILTSTDSSKAEIDRAKSVGASGWINKPVNKEQVDKVLERFLGI